MANNKNLAFFLHGISADFNDRFSFFSSHCRSIVSLVFFFCTFGEEKTLRLTLNICLNALMIYCLFASRPSKYGLFCVLLFRLFVSHHNS